MRTTVVTSSRDRLDNIKFTYRNVLLNCAQFTLILIDLFRFIKIIGNYFLITKFHLKRCR